MSQCPEFTLAVCYEHETCNDRGPGADFSWMKAVWVCQGNALNGNMTDHSLAHGIT